MIKIDCALDSLAGVQIRGVRLRTEQTWDRDAVKDFVSFLSAGQIG